MGNPYPAVIADSNLAERLGVSITFTDPANQPGGGGGGTVDSVFGRLGTVVAQAGDYTAAQVGAMPSTSDLSAIATANPTAANVSMNSHKVTGLLPATVSTDAASLANSLDQFTAPQANITWNAKKITGLANGTAAQDAAAFGQVPTTAAQVGAMPSTSDLSAIASANVTAANWSNNSKKITSVANGTAAQDAAAFGQIPTSASSIGGMLTATYDAAAIAQQVLGTTATQTVTNKRVTPRTGTVASSATPTINTDTVDFFSITALAVDITSMTTNLSGTPTDGQKLWLAITGTAARAITWGASFEASTIALPTTTVATARLDVGFVWNTATSKWRCVATC
jgi:hypothetical protein